MILYIKNGEVRRYHSRTHELILLNQPALFLRIQITLKPAFELIGESNGICRYTVTYSVTSLSGLSADPLQTNVVVWETGYISLSMILISQEFSSESAARDNAQALASSGTPDNLALCQAIASSLTGWLQKSHSLDLPMDTLIYFSWAAEFSQLFGETFLVVDPGSVTVKSVKLAWSGTMGNAFVSLQEVSVTVSSSASAWLRALPWFDNSRQATLQTGAGNSSASSLPARRLLSLENHSYHGAFAQIGDAALTLHRSSGKVPKTFARRQTLQGIDTSLFVTALQVRLL